MTNSTSKNQEDLKYVALKACNYLAQYQRLLESKGKAKEATEIKNTKDSLWEIIQKLS